FRMVAYTGGPMRIEGFPHPVVVDLEGLAIDRQDIPVRLDHSPRQGVGHTQRVAVEGGQVIAEGLISRDTSWARDVVKSGINGFPWQASIGAVVMDAVFIPNGQSITVNGRTFTGPIHVVRKATLKEISFVDSGADTNTSARVAANAKETNPMDETVTPKDVQDTPKPEAVKPGEPAPQPAAPASAPTPAMITASAPEGDPVAAMRQRMAAETRRVEAVRKACGGKFPDIEAQAIEEGWDETKVELHVLRASRPRVQTVVSSQRPSGPEVFEAVALMASGMPMSRIQATYQAPVLEAADKLRGVGIQEFCELACGQQLPRFRRDAAGWLQAAFSTTSLPGILSNVANKMLLEGYNYVEDAWRQVCRIASVNGRRCRLLGREWQSRGRRGPQRFRIEQRVGQLPDGPGHRGRRGRRNGRARQAHGGQAHGDHRRQRDGRRCDRLGQFARYRRQGWLVRPGRGRCSRGRRG
ncbi:MAG TPA: hypothetical protein VM098_07175, partial [Phycisphaerae bacterium]|nr:hypothetical protein [Phycisphaerae bacterium]